MSLDEKDRAASARRGAQSLIRVGWSGLSVFRLLHLRQEIDLSADYRGRWLANYERCPVRLDHLLAQRDEIVSVERMKLVKVVRQSCRQVNRIARLLNLLMTAEQLAG